ncbi:MAG: LysE family translocator [Spirochaetota bacterium]
MQLILYLLSALWIGFIVAVPPGGVTVIGIQYALKGNLSRTYAFIAGSSVVDCFYLLCVYTGIAALMSEQGAVRNLMYLACGALLLYMGVSELITLSAKNQRKGKEAAFQTDGSIPAAFIRGVLVTLTNPATVVGWLAVAGNFFLLWRGRWPLSETHEPWAVAMMIVGVELWFLPLLYCIHKTHHRLPVIMHRVLTVLSAVILGAMGTLSAAAGIAGIINGL